MGGGGFLGLGSSKKSYEQRTTSRPIWESGLRYAEPLTAQIQTGAATLPGVPSEEELYKTQSRRLLEGLRPGYAERGFLTSGVAQKAETEALRDLTQEFGSRAFERGMGRQQLSLEHLGRLLQTILGQQTTGETPVQTAGATTQFGFDFGK